MSQKKNKQVDNPEKLLIEIAKALSDLQTPYVITGGFAVAVWGRPRFTADIDIVVSLMPKNIEKLSIKLCQLGEDSYIDAEMIEQSLKMGREFNFIHVDSGMKVDFWVVDNDIDQKRVKRGIDKKFNGYLVSFISSEDLILSKLEWYKKSNLEKDLLDIKSVLKHSDVNLNYIKKNAQKQSTIDILENKILKNKQ